LILKRFSAIIIIGITVAFSIYMYSNSKNYVHTSVPVTGKKIIIDAGHGIPDCGASSQSGIKESEINLKIANELKKLLEKAKFKVIMTRSDENSLSNLKKGNKSDDMKKRVQIRNNSGGDIFISIHLNHFSQSQYRGAQVFYNPVNEKNAILAEALQNKLIKVADPNNTRTIKSTESLYVLNGSNIPCALVECGFLSNTEEAKLLSDEKYQKIIAKSLYLGICQYLTDNQE